MTSERVALDLLLLARDLIAKAPPHEFSLQGQDAIWWLAQDKFFQSLGLSVERGGAVYWQGSYVGYAKAATILFSLTEGKARELFGERPRAPSGLSDKGVVLSRLDSYLASLDSTPQRKRA